MEDGALRLLIFSAAVAPALLLLVYFAVALQEQVDEEGVWSSFCFGACAAFPAIVLVSLFGNALDSGDSIFALSAHRAFLLAAVPEEIAKLAVLLTLCWSLRKTLSATRLVMTGVACGCGFAALENVLYVLDSDEWGGLAVARSVSAVPGHAFVGAIMGYCFYRAAHARLNEFWWIAALVGPILLHGAYNTFLFATDYMDARHVGTLTQATYLLVIGFVVVVLIEGLLAHATVRFALRAASAPPKALTGDLNLVNQICFHWGGWAAIGVGCIAGAIALLVQTLGKDEGVIQVLYFGFVCFAVLHGLAFLVLSDVQRRRRNQLAMTIADRIDR